MSSHIANTKIQAGSRLRAGLLFAALSVCASVPVLGQSLVVTGNTPFPPTRMYNTTQQTLTLTFNDSVQVESLAIPAGYNGIDFTFYSADTCGPGATVAAGTVCNVVINFTPHLPGWSSAPAPISRSAPLQIIYYDNTVGELMEETIPLTGTGQGPQAVVVPGVISDLIGNDVTRPTGFGGDGSAAAHATFTTPAGVAMDVLGNIYIADTGNGVVRLYYQAGTFPSISGTLTPGNVYTIAGEVPVGGVSQAGAGTDNVLATNSKLNGPTGIAVDGVGNLYITDNNNQAVRMVSASTGVITTVAGTLNASETPGTGFAGDLGAATSANLYIPASVSVDGFGNLYIADSGNNAVRVVYEGGTALAALIATEISGTTATVGDIYTIAGGPANAALPSNGDGGLASAANLNSPTAVIVDSQGDVYIADTANKAVRRVDGVTGNIGTVYSGGDTPVGLAVDSSDSIDFTLKNSCTVMQYNPSLQLGLTSPATSVIAGNGTCLPTGDGGSSFSAGFSGAQGVVVDGGGNLYVLEADGVRTIVANGTPFDFGNVNVGNTSAPATVVVTDDDIQPYGGIQYYSTPGENFSLSTSYNTPYSFTPYVGTNANVMDCDSADFGGGNYSLSPGGSCGASFLFEPITDGGPFTNYAYSNNRANVSFTGMGTGPLPTATLTGTLVPFTAVAYETSSAPQTLVLKNTSAITLSISAIYFNTSDFRETDNCGISTYTANPTLAPGATRNINIIFSATNTATVNDTITVYDNTTSGSQTFPLSGTGTAPVGTFSVSSLVFPVTAPGGTASLPVTLTNTGTATLNINPTGFAITGNDPARFAITANTCGTTLAINAHCQLTISYSPLTYAYYSATLNVQDDTGGVRIYNSNMTPTYLWNTQTLGMIGPTGNPPIGTNLTAGNTLFPPIAVGSSETQTVTLTLGQAAALKSIAMTAGFTEYTIGAITGCVVNVATVNAAATVCDVPITFTPAAPGIRNAPLTAVDIEGSTNVPYSFALSGTGLGTVAALTPGIMTTVVGGSHGVATGIAGADGPAVNAVVGFQTGEAIDTAGQIYLADDENEVIWKTDTSGNIHMYAGSPFPPGGYTESLAGDGGTALGASLGYVGVIALDQRDGLYIAEIDATGDSPRIRYVDPATGMITTAIGFVPPGSRSNTTAYTYNTRIVVKVSGTNYIYVATAGGTSGAAAPVWPTGTGASIPDGSVVWLNEGVYYGGAGCTGETDTLGDGCLAWQASVIGVTGITVDPSGNVFFSDDHGALIRRVDAVTKIVTVVAGNGTQGYQGDGLQAIGTTAEITASDLAFDSNGNMIFIDDGGLVVREVTKSTGAISTLSGKNVYAVTANYCYGGGGYGGPALNASFSVLTGLAIDAANDIYLSDNSGCVVSRIDAGTNLIHIVAGQYDSDAFYSNPGYGDVGFGPYISEGDASAATLNQPYLIRLDGTGNIYIASSYGGVRKVDVSQSVLNFTGSVGAPWSYTTGGTPQAINSISPAQTSTVLNAGNQGTVDFTTPFEAGPLWGMGTTNFIRDINSPTGTADCYSLRFVAIGNECPVSVDFAPLAGNGYVYDTDTVNDNAVPGAGSQPIHLIGDVSSTVPLVTLTPFLLTFSTPQGTPSASQNLTLTNADVNALPISSIAITGSTAFTETNTCYPSLAANSQCTISVIFNPPVVPGGGDTTLAPPDILNAQVVVTDTATNNPSPQIASLIGTGTIPTTLPPTPLMINETLHLSDMETITPATTLMVSEIFNLADSFPTPVLSKLLPVNEIFHFSDVDTLLLTAVVIHDTETIHTTDTDYFPATIFIQDPETIHTTDTIHFPATVFIQTPETIHTTDTSHFPAYITDAETIHTTDLITPVISGKGKQTINFPAPVASYSFPVSPITLSATATSGLTVSFTVVSGPGTIPAGSNILTVTGTGTIVVAANQSGNSTYSAAAQVTQNYVVVLSTLLNDFSITLLGSGNQTIIPGGSANFQFTISPNNGVYAGIVNFTITGLPPGATASFSPPTIAANGGTQNVILTIQDPLATAEIHAIRNTVMLSLLLLPLWGVRKRKGLARLACILLVMIGGAAATSVLTGCSTNHNGFFGQSQQSYTVTITATSGTQQHSSTVTLVVE